MGFVRMLIGLPVILVIAIFAFSNNDLASFSLWPLDITITASLSVAIVFLLVLGYIIGKIDSWLLYAPVRSALRNQQKQNKKLNREQLELTGQIESLKDDLQNAKKAQTTPTAEPSQNQTKIGLKEKLSNLFKHKQKKNDDFWCL